MESLFAWTAKKALDKDQFVENRYMWRNLCYLFLDISFERVIDNNLLGLIGRLLILKLESFATFLN